MGSFWGLNSNTGLAGDFKGLGAHFIGAPPVLSPPLLISTITFVSGIVDCGPIFDVTAPGIAPPVLTLDPAHPGANDFQQVSGGALIGGDTKKILYSAVAVDFGIGLNICVVGGSYTLEDIQSVQFIGADSVHYNLGPPDFLFTRNDNGDPTLVFGDFQWVSVPTTAFADGVQTILTIGARFSFDL